MEFLHPEFLYYMLPPLFVLFGLLMTQKESHAVFFDESVMQRLRVSANTLSIRTRNALMFVVGILMILAMADPVIVDGEVEVQAKSSDIIIALDISDSMLAQDVYPDRLRVAKSKALNLLKFAIDERVGVVAFAKNSYLVSPLSFDHDAVSFLLSKLSTNYITEKGTDFLSLLEVVDKSIKKESKKNVLILTDGGDKKDFTKEIEFAKKHKITVFILTIGTKKGSPIKEDNGEFIKQNGKIIISKLNPNIASLATKSGGAYIEGRNSNADIKKMVEEIKAHTKKVELKSQKIRKYIHLFYYPLILAVVLLLIATSSLGKRRVGRIAVALSVGLLIFKTPLAEAGMLDFMQLKEAKKAYESKDYEKSQKLYGDYAKAGHMESYYNEANALYKAKKYKEAIKAYKKAAFRDKLKRADNLSNLGNAYAKSGGETNLKKAIDAYERSLKIREDKDTRENLEAVKKEWKKRENKKQNNKQNKKQNKKNKQNKKQQNKNNKQNKGNKQKQNQNNKKSSKDNRQNQQNKQQQNKENKNKGKKEQNKKNQSSKTKSQKLHKNRMSDAEERKWLKSLSNKQKSFMYMLNDPKNIKKEDADEKPW